MITYGRVITEEGWRDGVAINRIQRIEESIPIHNKQELLDNLFAQLDRLKTEHSVAIEIFADKHSHEPVRMVVTRQHELD